MSDWEASNADLAVEDGILNVTNRTEGRLGIAERREVPSVNEWTIQARMGRTTRRARPGVVSLTGHGRFTAVRLVLRTLDEDDGGRDRTADVAPAAVSRNYEFALFDGAVGEWVLVTNLSGGSESVAEESGEFTTIALGLEGGDFVAYAGEAGVEEELLRFDLATSEVDGVGLGEIVSDVTGLWLVNQGVPGLTAQHDWVRLTGNGSHATPPDGAAIADAPDAATRSVSVLGPDADRAALVALYEATDGPNWKNSENWLTDAPLGEWYGVDADANGRVIRLYLGRKQDGQQWVRHGLSGSIPPELGTLEQMTELVLAVNDLSGPVPPELGNVEGLKNLDLAHNELTGPIPPELGGLANLEILNLIDNELTGDVPPELGGLTRLWALELGVNFLTGSIPPELGNLVDLEYLNVQLNRLTGEIPPELGNLVNLSVLWLHQNNLAGPIPPELGRLVNLDSLRLGSNELTGRIPPELGDLTRLSDLDLGVNSLTGTIPPELGKLSNLESLNVAGNKLTGAIPGDLGNLTSLSILQLWDNDLTGEIPPQLGNLPNHAALYLSGNRLTGSIPAELGNLRTVSLGGNELTGTLPQAFGDLGILEWLVIGGNRLTGEIPTSFLGLSLRTFRWGGNAGLCAPDTAAFRAWMATIEQHAPGPFCSDTGGSAALRRSGEAATALAPQLHIVPAPPLRDWPTDPRRKGNSP